MFDESTYNQSISHQLRHVDNKDRKIEHYQLLKIIGTGTFGKVFLAQLEDKSFAVKILPKRKIIELNQLEHIKSEKNLLASTKHPFIVNLIESF